MVVRDYKVVCPICKGTIVVDARNGKIIRHFEVDEREEDEKPDPVLFDQALDKVSQSGEEKDTTFSDAMRKVSERKDGLGDLFKKAKDKADEIKDDEPRPEDRPDFWD